MKIIFVVIDGLGDEEIPDFGNKTPLEKARTPNLDKWAKEGKTGVLVPTFYGIAPTSEEGHFSLFGYDPRQYELKRGIVTAKSVNMEIEQDDVALRGNFATLLDGEIIDRRAGRIKNTKNLIRAINGIEIEGAKFLVAYAFEHRVAVLAKGEGLSSSVTNSDPAYNESGKLEAIKPAKEGEKEEFTASVLNKFTKEVHQILKDHPENKEKELPANCLLLRGASKEVKLPSFEDKYGVRAACIAGKELYREIGKMMKMTPLAVEGATGFTDTNIKGKFEKAFQSDFDFVFVHIKATDTLAEDGDYRGKADFLEKIDEHISLFDRFKGVLVITSDHSTCSMLKRHCDKEIPFLFRGRGEDNTKRFTEKECERGSFGRIRQVDMIETVKLFYPC